MTRSHVDLNTFPTWESFGQCVAGAFITRDSKVTVQHLARYKESCQDGGPHYHMSIKLSDPKRWLSVKNSVEKLHGTVLHFSDKHDNYHSAYRYICKTDKNVAHSIGYPNLTQIGSPRTKICVSMYCQKRKSARRSNEPNKTKERESEQQAGSSKRRRLSNLEVAEFMIRNNIRRSTVLYAVTNKRKAEGDKDLAEFVLSRSSKTLQELIQNTWELENTKANLEREDTKRMDIVTAASEGECEEGCGGQWLRAAIEVLTNNNVHPVVFADAMRTLLEKSRGMFRNIMVTGPTKLWKDILLHTPTESIQSIFKSCKQ